MPDIIAVIKGRIGDWQYYVSRMKLGQVARDFVLGEGIYPNRNLDELTQRAIGDRVQKEMVPYLLNEKQRLYGALVVAVYGGEPAFSPVKVEPPHEMKASPKMCNEWDEPTGSSGVPIISS